MPTYATFDPVNDLGTGVSAPTQAVHVISPRLPSQKYLQDNVDIGAYVKRVRADLEKGQLSPTFDLLQRWAKGLGLDLAALFSGGVSGHRSRCRLCGRCLYDSRKALVFRLQNSWRSGSYGKCGRGLIGLSLPEASAHIVLEVDE